MIPSRPIRRILAATDLLTSPEEFVANAAVFAATCGAELHVLHAHPDSRNLGIGGGDWLDLQRHLHEKRIALRDLLDSALTPAQVQLVRSASVRLGNPADEILSHAARSAVDLIVLGPHRPRPVGDRYLGSTAERVLHEAAVPCLILNAPARAPVRRILVAADFSAPSAAALRCGMAWVRTLSDRGPAEIDYVHVVKDGTGSAEDRRLELEHEVRAITTEADAKVPVTVHLRYGGDPSDALIGFSEERGSDLVVMGTRGDSVLMRGLLGSLSSEMLRRSKLPLLVVPPLAFERRPERDREAAQEIHFQPLIY
jgi:universal stress protein E